MFDEKLVQKAIDDLTFKFPFTASEWAVNPIVENYHKHSDYSNGNVPDSVESMENYAKRTVELGGTCLFSGEHGSQGDQFLTYKLCEKYGLKYRHSTEAYWVKDRHEKDRHNCHIVLVAKNPEGRKEINYVLSMANIDGYYYQPRIDLSLLFQINPENVYVTSACVAGWKYEDSFEIWKKIADHFKDNFFIEVQYHLIDFQVELNKKLLEFAKENGYKIICGLDSHLVLPENEMKRKMYQSDKTLEYAHDEEIGSVFMDYPDCETLYNRFKQQGVLSDTEILTAMMNTLIFRVECEDIVFDRNFKIPNIYHDLDYEGRVHLLKQIVNDMYKKETLKTKEKIDGIQWEVNQFIESGTVDYPLFSRACVQKAVTDFGGVLTTTSRGSAASFITNKLMGLTTVDRFNAEIPIHPQRFLTKERIMAGTLPDVDLNCASQEPFIQSAKALLGEHGAYPLMNLNKLKAKKAWKMYARINNVSPQESDEISKALEKYEKAVLYAEEDEKELIQVEDYIPQQYIGLYYESVGYQGITDSFGTHACGVLCFDGDIRREIGLISAKSETKGTRKLVACIEGKYLDEFGYVKEDFLIVDTVALTHKLFQAIGENVPSFEELKELVKDDPKTWEIYAKGITCCVNQCEKEPTKEKVKKYKPKSIAELSAFVAAIRPGFKSLLNTFLNRENYTTGEKEIDNILEESAHFMLYQESIMAILSFLGMEMGDTYNIIKSISKKKLKGKMKDDLMVQLKKGWMEHFGNLNNFQKVWNVVEDAAAYAFNSPHSYSMAGDSLYSAWFKAHHTSKFYEVAINHYMDKDKKDKMVDLTKEAIQFFGYRLGDYEYGKDNRRTNVDDENKVIYPPLSNIKGMGHTVGEELYNFYEDWGELSSFWNVLKEMKACGVKINGTQLEKLIKLNYYKKFGSVTDLLKIKEQFDKYVQIKGRVGFKKIQQLGLDLDLARTFGRSAKSTIMEFDKDGFFEYMLEHMEKSTDATSDRVKWQLEVLGYSDIRDVNYPKQEFFVVNIEPRNKYGLITLYSPNKGSQFTVKYWDSALKRDPLTIGDHVKIPNLKKKPVRAWNGKFNEETGKRIYEVVDGKYEYWLEKYARLG